MMIASPGGGKTAYVLYPNIEYAMACGVSVTLDTIFIGDTAEAIIAYVTPKGCVCELVLGGETEKVELDTNEIEA